ncbi:hypothetical protein GY45DRAFT_1320074 [Cubamyces sp. BRFM 1775]|nr:hypothetical protein GY45DRAFT_1320074 [Cubamyces sp. BRFM 1775]
MSGAAMPDTMPPPPDPTADEALLTAPKEFERDHSASLVVEFKRLAAMRRWENGSKQYEKHRRECMKTWATEDFGECFGHNAKDLDAWGKLCRHLGLTMQCNSVVEYQRSLKSVHLNLVDLVDSCKTQTRPQLFATKKELVDYMVETEKIYPIHAARSNPFLTAFLVEVKENGKMPRNNKKKNRGARKRRMLKRSEGGKEGGGPAAKEGGRSKGIAAQGEGKRKRRRSGWRWRKAKAAKAAKATQDAQAQTAVVTAPVDGQ